MILTELDVVNDQLATMGEAPVTSLNIKHAYISAGLQKLARASQSTQAQRWWFNFAKVQVTPTEAEDYVIDAQLPCGTMMVWAFDASHPVTWRNGQILRTDDTTVVVEPVDLWVHFEVPFRDLPVSANLCVAAKAVLDFQKTYDADSTKTKELKEEWREKFMLMSAEHIRTKKVNLLTRASTAHNKLRVRGNRSYVVN